MLKIGTHDRYYTNFKGVWEPYCKLDTTAHGHQVDPQTFWLVVVYCTEATRSCGATSPCWAVNALQPLLVAPSGLGTRPQGLGTCTRVVGGFTRLSCPW